MFTRISDDQFEGHDSWQNILAEFCLIVSIRAATTRGLALGKTSKCRMNLNANTNYYRRIAGAVFPPDPHVRCGRGNSPADPIRRPAGWIVAFVTSSALLGLVFRLVFVGADPKAIKSGTYPTLFRYYYGL